MPIYEYRCENGHLTERFQRMSDPPLEVCDVCGAAVQKVLHPVAIHFKGSGFYNTDYGKGKGAKTDGARAEGGGEGGASGGNGAGSGDGGSTAPASTGTSGGTGTGGGSGTGSGGSSD